MEFFSSFGGKRFNGPLPCLLATNLKHFGFSAFMWLYEKLKSFIKAGQATMNSKSSPTESPLCWGYYVLARLARPKDNTTSNRFGIQGSSPPESREGSIYELP